jgi:hypothetical protein
MDASDTYSIQLVVAHAPQHYPSGISQLVFAVKQANLFADSPSSFSSVLLRIRSIVVAGVFHFW